MAGTASVKIVVIYPRPIDESEFERAYNQEHIPMVEDKMKGITRLVLTKVLSSPQGKVSAYRMAEVHFSTLGDLHKATDSEAGPPIMLVCSDETFVYW